MVRALLLALLPAPVLAQETPAPPLTGPPALVRAGTLPEPLPQLAQFHRRLADLAEGRTQRLTVLQIGDSHTEADHFSGRLRMLLQDRFGNAGRGMLPPGAPFPWWRPYQVRAEQSAGWHVLTSNKTGHEPLPFGLSGVIVRGANAADVMTLTAGDDVARFDAVEIGIYRQPGGGILDLKVDGQAIGEIDTRGGTYAMDRRAFAVPKNSRRLELRPRGNGPVDIADWTATREARGVVLTSHGFSGAQVGIMSRWDWPTVTAQLAHLDPALVLIAFGTNEGYAPASRLSDYAERLQERVEALQKAAPNASIVLVGGPDANRLPKSCGGSGAEHDRLPCRPLSDEEVAGYDGLLAHSDRRLCRWHTPASYHRVRAAQREVADKTGIYLWDWLEFQGGFCSAYRWEKLGLVHKDRVHMKRDGYWRSADRLHAILLRGFRPQ